MRILVLLLQYSVSCCSAIITNMITSVRVQLTWLTLQAWPEQEITPLFHSLFDHSLPLIHAWINYTHVRNQSPIAKAQTA